MALVTLIVIEPGRKWPSEIGAFESVVVGHDNQALLWSTRERLSSLRRQRHHVREALLVCNDATDLGSVERRAEVAHELLTAVAPTRFGRLVLSSVDSVSVELRRELLSLAGALTCKLQGALVTVSARFSTARDGERILPRRSGSGCRPAFAGPRPLGVAPARSACARSGVVVRGLALVIDAVNVILRHLAELPDGPEVPELRDRALGYIEEVAMWNTSRPSVETREAMMKKVLALHVVVNKLGVDRSQGRHTTASQTYGSTE